jgi:hypothetical protein
MRGLGHHAHTADAEDAVDAVFRSDDVAHTDSCVCLFCPGDTHAACPQ